MTRPQQTETINILIAEDEKNISDLLVELLYEDNRIIDIVHNGQDAIKKLKTKKYDLLITDLMMPDADGIQVLHESKRFNPQIIVIIITGYASLETAIQAVKEGAYDYLRKPFRLEELKISVDNACEKIGLLRENRTLLEDLKEKYFKIQKCEEEASEKKIEELEMSGLRNTSFIDVDRLPPSFFETGSIWEKSPIDTLEKLTNLRKQEMITEEEFSKLKEKLINNL